MVIYESFPILDPAEATNSIEILFGGRSHSGAILGAANRRPCCRYFLDLCVGGIPKRIGEGRRLTLAIRPAERCQSRGFVSQLGQRM